MTEWAGIHALFGAFLAGVLMNTRGLMEFVVLNVGLEHGGISPTFFTMMVLLVLMALVTTAMTSPLLGWLRRGQPPRAVAPATARCRLGSSGWGTWIAYGVIWVVLIAILLLTLRTMVMISLLLLMPVREAIRRMFGRAAPSRRASCRTTPRRRRRGGCRATIRWPGRTPPTR
jgi:Kef-type K+ transport system membrane component KefB